MCLTFPDYSPGQEERLREARQNDVLNAYEGITFSTGIADHMKPVIAYGRSAEDTVYNQLFGYFKAMGCKYNPTTIRKGVERAMKLKDADTMSHEELFERAKKYIENGGTDLRKCHKKSPMADVDPDNDSMPKAN